MSVYVCPKPRRATEIDDPTIFGHVIFGSSNEQLKRFIKEVFPFAKFVPNRTGRVRVLNITDEQADLAVEHGAVLLDMFAGMTKIRYKVANGTLGQSLLF